jgi:hypothetical protein
MSLTAEGATTLGNPAWLYIGGVVWTASGLAFAATLLRRRWTISALIVGLAHLGMVWLNAAAPFRGLLDPNYGGYDMGFLEADIGLEVTLLSASVLAAAMASALIAGLNRPGKPMLVVSGTSAFLAWNTLFWLAAVLWQDPSQVKIQLGELLTIPAFAAVPLLLLLFVGPFAYGARWSWRRAFE